MACYQSFLLQLYRCRDLHSWPAEVPCLRTTYRNLVLRIKRVCELTHLFFRRAAGQDPQSSKVTEAGDEREQPKEEKRKEVVATHWCVLCREDGSMEVSPCLCSSLVAHVVCLFVMFMYMYIHCVAI